jgi:hypothetical protein
LLIEDYFQQLQAVINHFSLVQLFTINPDKRSNYKGFVLGEVTFRDGSVLFWREFVNVENFIERGMYSYQYMDSSKQLIFRYDNAQHHKKLNLPTYPHHKHKRSEENIVASFAPTLAEVLQEIEGLLL